MKNQSPEVQKKEEELLPFVWCELCGVSDYYIEHPWKDLQKKVVADLVCKKCKLVLLTFHSKKTK